MTKHSKYLALALLLASGTALAGGLDSANSFAQTFKTWLYTFIGITSVIYLLFKGVQVKIQKATWGDFGTACVWVAILGGIPAIATYMWSIWA